MSKFYFEVDLAPDLKGIAFQEVSGMDLDLQIIEYKYSNIAPASTIKMPGIAKYGNVTLKRGVFVNDNTFWNWYNKVSINTMARGTVLIKLLDESGNVTMQWKLLNAWPTKITGTELKSDGNEVAVYTIEIAHEQSIVYDGR